MKSSRPLTSKLLLISARCVAFLPLIALYLISDIAAFVLHRVLKYRHTVVNGNLAKAFPEKSAAERKQIAGEFYKWLCDMFIETFKLANISDKEIERRVKITGIEHIDDAVANGQSVVLMIGHFGNWEWITSIARKLPSAVVASEIYHPLSSRAFDDLMLTLRSRFGTENIPMKQAYRKLVEIERSGKQFVCGFISDQRPLTDNLKHWTSFLGIDTPYMAGGEVIADRLGAKMVYVEMIPVKRGYYHMNITPLERVNDDEENPMSRAYYRALEGSIRRTPHCWLWSHNRWVTARSQRFESKS